MGVDGTTYSAGNLEFKIQAMSKDTTASFSDINTQLQTMVNLLGDSAKAFTSIKDNLKSISRLRLSGLVNLSSGLEKIKSVDLDGVGDKLTQIASSLTPFKELSKNVSGIGQVGTFANGLDKLTKIDIGNVDTRIKQLTQSLKPFLAEITSATPALTAFSSAMNSLAKKRTIKFSKFENVPKEPKEENNLPSAFNLTKLVNKVYFLRNYTKQMFRSIAGIVEKAVDYTETLNLWQVAMRNNRAEAEQFINTMNRAYGISTQTLMNYQAIFRNMLSSLGGISEMTSYALSEYLTQMALDYASLYNTSIEKAMTTFQAVLSGQVRPIRSIAGYDITETTIYQLYQQLGGTKTMRQLTQTEKRLLRIYAVFQQMESSGAIGDLAKTLDNTANQMRIFTESTKELGTWLGIWLESFIKPILPYLNAIVITLTNIVKAIVKMKGIEMFEGGIESVQEFNEELDETTGKLLSFDRFEALNSTAGNDNMFGIDESLLAGLSKYQSILDGVTGKAQELVEKWDKFFIERDPEGNIKGLTTQGQILVDVVTALAIGLGSLIVLGIGKKIIKLIGNISGLTTKMRLLNFVIVGGVVFAILQAVDAFKKGDIAGGLLATTIGIILVGAFIKLNKQLIIDKWQSLVKVVTELGTAMKTKLAGALIGIIGDWNLLNTAMKVTTTIGIITLLAGIISLFANWGNMSESGKIISVLVAITAGVVALAVALKVLQGNWLGALGVAGLVAGASLLVTTNLNSLKQYKNGGQVEDGIFTMSKGEIIGNFDDGSTVVANNQQIIQGIQQGVYSAVVSAMRQSGGNGGVGDVYLNGRKVGMATARSSHNENVRTGLVRVNS